MKAKKRRPKPWHKLTTAEVDLALANAPLEHREVLQPERRDKTSAIWFGRGTGGEED